jgi:transposase
MPIPYSNDLRKRVISLINKGKKQSHIAKMLDIDKSTIFRWNKSYKRNGNCNFKGYNQNQDKRKITDLVKFEELIKNNNLTLEEYSLELGNVKREAVRITIKKIGYSYKKNSGYIKNEMKRQEIDSKKK